MHSLAENTSFWRSGDLHIAVGPHKSEDARGLAAFAAQSEATRRLLYFQTSGSEGGPKWVGLSYEAFLYSARAVNEHLEATSQDRWLIALPLHHVGGFSILARCHEIGAGFVTLDEKWSPHRFAIRCQEAAITLASLVPAQVHDLVQAGLEAPQGLRAVVVGGGGIPSAGNIASRAIELGWPLLQSFGMTEACSQIATEPLHHLHSGFDPNSLEILRGWDPQADEEGKLILKGSALASGYAVQREGKWEWEPINADHGLATRDRVQLWWHGTRQFLRFLGRESSFVKVLGELVNLHALQSRLEESAVNEGVPARSVVIVPQADARMGTKLVLVGEVSAELLERVRQEFNNKVMGYERFDRAQYVPQLPRTALGKIDASALASLLGGPLSSSQAS